MKNTLLTILLGIIPILAFTQTTGSNIKVEAVNPVTNPADKVLESLIGEGIVIKSFTTNKESSSHAFGTYKDEENAMGISDGVILTSGTVDLVVGQNTSSGMTTIVNNGATVLTNGVNHSTIASGGFFGTAGDADLETLLPNGHKTFDACIIEMEVVSMADTLAFNYVFGSEEYPEYVYSEFNDAFAFFISGPGIDTTQNLAVIPGTNTPVTINNVNGGNPALPTQEASNQTFYKQNVDINLEYDGFTRTFEVKQKVIPYQTYHIKIVVADVSDNVLDSGVLIETESIISYHDAFALPFDDDDYTLNDNTAMVLDNVDFTMRKKNVKKILVSGHTDSNGSEEYNYNLAQQRIDRVVDYLIDLGLNENQIIVQNRGETMPIASNETSEGRALNRRVEIKLLGNDEEYLEQQEEIYTEEAEEFGAKAQLMQNYPNPARGKTTIPFFIPDNVASAEIQIYSTDMRKVQLISISQRGAGEVDLNAINIPSGQYLYNLLVDGKQVDTKKMVILK